MQMCAKPQHRYAQSLGVDVHPALSHMYIQVEAAALLKLGLSLGRVKEADVGWICVTTWGVDWSTAGIPAQPMASTVQ